MTTVPEFFSGKNVLITGGSGFLGKVLIEKLLRSCPNIGNLYILLREKRGVQPEERLKAMLKLPVFELLMKQQPNAYKKLKFIRGDVALLKLGLSEENQNTIKENVHIIYHVAATVRFDEPLTKAILFNVRGTREIVKLAQEMKNLQVFLYTSTAYSNPEYSVVEEKMYPSRGDWNTLIEIAEKADNYTVDVFTGKCLEDLPNTYTFTKSVAEHVVADMCKGKIPAVILRPSIVISTYEEPIEGWVENFNGPFGVFTGVGTGLLRSVFFREHNKEDFIPVDICIKSMVVSSWHKALSGDKELSIYNSCGNGIYSMSPRMMLSLGEIMIANDPLHEQFWHPACTISMCPVMHYLRVIFLHMLPAMLMDFILKLTGKKPMLAKLQRKIYLGTNALGYFGRREWEFHTKKLISLNNALKGNDYKEFSFERVNVDVEKYMLSVMNGGRHYLLKEDRKNMGKYKTRGKVLKAIHYVLKSLVYGLFLWYIWTKLVSTHGSMIYRAKQIL